MHNGRFEPKLSLMTAIVITIVIIMGAAAIIALVSRTMKRYIENSSLKDGRIDRMNSRSKKKETNKMALR